MLNTVAPLPLFDVKLKWKIFYLNASSPTCLGTSRSVGVLSTKEKEIHNYNELLTKDRI